MVLLVVLQACKSLPVAWCLGLTFWVCYSPPAHLVLPCLSKVVTTCTPWSSTRSFYLGNFTSI